MRGPIDGDWRCPDEPQSRTLQPDSLYIRTVSVRFVRGIHDPLSRTNRTCLSACPPDMSGWNKRQARGSTHAHAPKLTGSPQKGAFPTNEAMGPWTAIEQLPEYVTAEEGLAWIRLGRATV